MAYKEIKTDFSGEASNKGPKPLEIELDDLQNNEIDEDQELEGFANLEPDEQVDDESKQVKQPEQAKPKLDPKKEEVRRHRARERIQELANEKRELKLMAEEQARLIEQMRNQLVEKDKSSTKSLKTSIEQQVATLNTQLRQAIQDGDSDLVVKLQDHLTDAKIELKELSTKENQITDFERSQQAKPKVQKQQEVVQIPEGAKAWIKEHPEFNTDPVFYAAALAVNNVLTDEGWDPDSDEFYEEISARLTPRFPEVFGVEDKNNVTSRVKASKAKVPSNQQDDEYDELEVENDDSSDEETQTDSKKSVKTSQQTMSGASRSPSSQINLKNRNKEKVRLTEEEVMNAERWGISLEQLARRKMHIEKNQGSNNQGYVPIMIDTK